MIRSKHVAASATIMLLSVWLLAVQQTSPIRVSDSDQEKKLIKKIEPVYPEIAQRVPVRGPVILSVVANEKGEVVEVKVDGGGNPVVQKPVADAVKQWRYSPTYVEGKAISVKFRVKVPIVIKKNICKTQAYPVGKLRSRTNPISQKREADEDPEIAAFWRFHFCRHYRGNQRAS